MRCGTASNHELAHVAVAQPEGIQDFLVSALEGFVFYFNAGIAIVAYVGQGGHVFAPVHISQPRQLGRHIFQRISHSSHVCQFVVINFDILVMHMENFISELIQRPYVINSLPYKMGWVVVKAEAAARNQFKSSAPDGRRGHEVLAAGPLVGSEEHRAVFYGDFYPVFLGHTDQRRPDFLENCQIFFYGFSLDSADEGSDSPDAEPGRRLNHFLQMGYSLFPLFQIIC